MILFLIKSKDLVIRVNHNPSELIVKKEKVAKIEPKLEAEESTKQKAQKRSLNESIRKNIKKKNKPDKDIKVDNITKNENPLMTDDFSQDDNIDERNDEDLSMMLKNLSYQQKKNDKAKPSQFNVPIAKSVGKILFL